MRKLLSTALALSLGLGLGFTQPALSHAKGAKKAKPAAKAAKPPAKPKAPPKANVKAVTDLMGAFKWGMTLEQVLGVLGKQIDERYAEKIKLTGDILAQNALRKEAAEEKKALRQGWVEFSGKPTSWDVSIVDREFDQKNDEAMLVLWEKDAASGKDQRRFFFFVDGKLWKMFIQFNAEAFEDKTFDDFKKIMEARYGAGAVAMRKNPDGTEEQDSVQWRGDGAFLRAIDLTKFYSSFCIAISDDAVEAWIGPRRGERSPKKKSNIGIADAVAEDPNKAKPYEPPADNADVVKDITGKKKAP